MVPNIVPIQGESAGKAISGQDKLGNSKSLPNNNLAQYSITGMKKVVSFPSS